MEAHYEVQTFCLNETRRIEGCGDENGQYHKQHAKQSTDMRVNNYIVSARTKKLEGKKQDEIPLEIAARNIRTSL